MARMKIRDIILNKGKSLRAAQGIVKINIGKEILIERMSQINEVIIKIIDKIGQGLEIGMAMIKGQMIEEEIVERGGDEY